MSTRLRLLIAKDKMAASDQFHSLSKLNHDQYRALCNYFYELILSKRLPMDKAFTRREVIIYYLFL